MKTRENDINSMVAMVKLKVSPPLDHSFLPAALWNRAYRDEVRRSGAGVPLVIALERGDGSISRFETRVLPPGHPASVGDNLFYAERLIKSLLWMRGGYKVIVCGPRPIGRHLKKTYSPRGARAFDADLMSTAYGKKFIIRMVDQAGVPRASERTRLLGRHLDGCRIGFDLGASDRKVCAVINGETVFSEEVTWDPRNQSDPRYHYHQVMSSLHQAASHLPRLDAIGGSAAGIYIHNRPRVASLFRGIPRPLFEREIRPMFERIRRFWRVPLEVANDGDVTALAGSMSLNANRVLGISLGSSQAGGYVTAQGNITAWLNELAFAPVDCRSDAPADEWSGDIGCGVQYFSQQAVFRLAAAAGIPISEKLAAVDRLKAVQELLQKGDERARRIFETIGTYLGYGIAHYADFYDIAHVLILGRVTSGEAGGVILKQARMVLKKEFPELAARIALHLPDEKSRRIGQAAAAASLPALAPRK